MAEYHINFECGCILDRHGDDEWCEKHRHTPVVREGASHRSGDQLAETFVDDGMNLTYVKPTNEQMAEAAVVIEACEEDHAVNGVWLGNDDLREELEALVRKVEGMLTNAGWNVDWDDGYVIWRPTADNPVAEYRHRIEVDG